MIDAPLCCGHSVNMPAVRSLVISIHDALRNMPVFFAGHVGSDRADGAHNARTDARTLRFNVLARVLILFQGRRFSRYIQYDRTALGWYARDLPPWLDTALWWRRRGRRSIRNWDFPSPAVRVRGCSQHSSSIDHADGMLLYMPVRCSAESLRGDTRIELFPTVKQLP